MKLEHIGYLLLTLLFILLGYAGYLSQKSIDWDVLKKMEAQKLVLPTQMPQTNPAILPSTTSATKK